MPIENVRTSIERAIQYLDQHPEKAHYTDSDATSTIEDTLRCIAIAPDGTEVKTDMPPGVGGEGAAPSPGWLMRAALANCDATLIAMRAAQVGIRLTELEVIVDSESDDRGLLGIDDDVPAGPLIMRTRIRIAAEDADQDRIGEILEWAEKHSPVADAIRRAVPMTTEVNFE